MSIAFLGVKEHSERFPRKNFARLPNGLPLYQNMIRTLMASTVGQIVVDSDAPEVEEYVRALPCFGGLVLFMNRRNDMYIDGNGMLVKWVDRYTEEVGMLSREAVVLQTYATAPMLHPSSIDRALLFLAKNPLYDSVVTVKRIPEHFVWMDTSPAYDLNGFGATQDWPHRYFCESNGFHMIRVGALRALGRRVGNVPYFMELSKAETVDIDYEEDMVHVREDRRQ